MSVFLLIASLAPVLGMAAISASSRRPSNLGALEGRLAPCPNSPNAVSSQCRDSTHWIAPIHFEGPLDAAMQRLSQVISALPGSQIITREENYLHVEFTSRWFRFVDDAEFLAEPETGRFHLRSASRSGHYDFEVNRNRIETIRRAFQAAESSNAGDSGNDVSNAK